LLPLSKEVLGYTNRWYEGALKNATSVTLSSGARIRVISAPFFLGTKIEAFRGRGRNDFLASHDLEDFISVIDGRSTILEEIEALQEIEAAPIDIKQHLTEAASFLLSENRFLDVLPGYVLDEGRVPLILERLRALGRASPLC
jgi:hypothetical protein